MPPPSSRHQRAQAQFSVVGLPVHQKNVQAEMPNAVRQGSVNRWVLKVEAQRPYLGEGVCGQHRYGSLVKSLTCEGSERVPRVHLHVARNDVERGRAGRIGSPHGSDSHRQGDGVDLASVGT